MGIWTTTAIGIIAWIGTWLQGIHNDHKVMDTQLLNDAEKRCFVQAPAVGDCATLDMITQTYFWRKFNKSGVLSEPANATHATFPVRGVSPSGGPVPNPGSVNQNSGTGNSP